ncbi:cysteine hydrolase family protein [Stenotrophomonas maltophilia]|uniref:cysteine hydrolase family protein n=1 Tax=Stenotrophomonas maltophilia TaxID=40324 RepID=UPI001F52BBE7|nr:isochorismatase family cysteine hydrolase [Stenotrophomonas maltophilia]
MSTPALLIIDLFSKFDFPDGQQLAPLALRAAKKAGQIRAAFDERGWPVIYANDNFGDWKCGFHQLAEVCRHEDGPAGDIARLLFPGPDHYTVLKPKHSAFLATPLAVLLAKLDVRTLVLVGMALDSCIHATAIDAHSREFSTVVISDATACLPKRRSAALTLLRSTGSVQVRTTGALLQSLESVPRRSANDHIGRK